MKVSLALAFSSGLLATVNPCGFAMLPAYLSYFLAGSEEDAGRTFLDRAGGGLAVGAAVIAGFLTIFSGAGLLLAVGLRGLTKVVPWIALGVGLVLLVLGLSAVSGRHIAIRLPAIKPRPGRGFKPAFVFGVAYAVASLSCTLPIFLNVVGTSLTLDGVPRLVALFAFYGAGAGAVLLGVSMSAAVAKGGMVRLLRRAIPVVERVSGALLAVAGGYVVFYWTINLAEADPGSLVRAPIRALESIQSMIAGWLDGPKGAAVALAVLAASAGVWVWVYWRRSGESRSASL